jgi:hypothetical protein
MSWKDRYEEIKVGDIVEYYRFTDANGGPMKGRLPIKIGTKLIINQIIKSHYTKTVHYDASYLDTNQGTGLIIWAPEIRKV